MERRFIFIVASLLIFMIPANSFASPATISLLTQIPEQDYRLRLLSDQYFHREISNSSGTYQSDYEQGWRKLSIDDTFEGSATSSIYAGKNTALGTSFELCESINSGFCSDSSFNFVLGESLLPVCSESLVWGCIESLRVGSSSSAQAATLMKELPGYTFAGNRELDIPNGGTMSVWNAPNLPHTGGTDYTVMAQVSWSMQNGKVFINRLNLKIAATQERATPQTHVTIPSACIGNNPGSGNYQVKGRCANHNPGKNGCMYILEGICAYEQEFSPGTRMRLSLRVSDKLTGWLHGRVKDPVVDVTSLGSGMNRLTIDAEPVTVPKLHARWNIKDIPGVITDLPRGMWGDGNLMAGAQDQESLEIVNKLREHLSDTATGQKTYWSLVSTGGNGTCLADKNRIVGVVTTNAMTYLGGPPQFSNGALTYQVAGLHFEPNGKTEFLGTYDLVMRSDAARCLYGYSSAPVSAAVTVTGDQGKELVATTFVSEKNGWLKVAAYGFTFSKKKIEVKLLSQAKKKTTLTCVNVKKPLQVKKITSLNPRCPLGYKVK